MQHSSLTEYYFDYLEQIGEGKIKGLDEFSLHETDPMRRAIELQQIVKEIGIPSFVKKCAAYLGDEIPDELYTQYTAEDVLKTLNGNTLIEDVDNLSGDNTPTIEEPDGPRNAFEVLIDCCNLDQNILLYLIDVLKRRENNEFQKLALVTTRKAFLIDDFTRWFSEKEMLDGEETEICVTVMDTVLKRLINENQKELVAALLSGDQKTYELFRCEAPELIHLPNATYQWYTDNYLNKYYPMRFLLRFNGIDI